MLAMLPVSHLLLRSSTALYFPVPPALVCSRNLQNISAPLTSPSFRISGTLQVNQYPALLAEIHPARPKSRLQI